MEHTQNRVIKQIWKILKNQNHKEYILTDQNGIKLESEEKDNETFPTPKN